MILGIDASNINQGGGITHIKELIDNFSPKKNSLKKIIIWGNSTVLSSIKNKKGIVKKNIFFFEKNVFLKLVWQTFFLSGEAKKNNCDTLFILGGIFLGGFRPFVSIYQNLLPFDKKEWKNYKITKKIKMFIQNKLKKYTIKNSNQNIFLTFSSKKIIENEYGGKIRNASVIYHGINKDFRKKPKIQKKLKFFSKKNPLTIIYVSKIEMYKHHCNVAKAFLNLKSKGYPIRLLFVGPSYSESLDKLKDITNLDDSNTDNIKYLGEVSQKHLINLYKNSDISIFASTCETFGQPLVESMSMGLPLITSSAPVVKEVIGNNGIYFNPLSVKSIQSSLQKIIMSKKIRANKAWKLFKLSKKYSWKVSSEKSLYVLLKSCQKRRSN